MSRPTTISALAPAARLLLLCTNPASTDAEIRGVVASGEVDWSQLREFANREFACPPLWDRLEAVAADGVPSEFATDLRGLARVVRFKMLYLEQRLAETVGVLADAKVDCLLLKGAAVGSTVRRPFADRPMIDLDLLVRPEQSREALDALLDRGGWKWRADRNLDDNYGSLHHLPALLDARGMEVSLELHTAPLWAGNPFTLTTPALFASSHAAPEPLDRARVPHPAHLLLHTCVHFAWSHLLRTHAWRAFRDVQALIDHDLIDWRQFVSIARDARGGTCAYWTLRLAHDLMDVPVPAHALAALRPPLPRAVLAGLARHYALGLFPAAADCPSVTVQRLFWSAGILPRWSQHGDSRRWTRLPASAVPSYAVPAGASWPREQASLNVGEWLRYARALAHRHPDQRSST